LGQRRKKTQLPAWRWPAAITLTVGDVCVNDIHQFKILCFIANCGGRGFRATVNSENPVEHIANFDDKRSRRICVGDEKKNLYRRAI
jgi:hypothetical protein